MLQLSVVVARRSPSLPTWGLQKLWGPGLRGRLGQPWGHGGSLCGQRSADHTQPHPQGLALPSPLSWCCASLGLSAGEVLPLRGGPERGTDFACPRRVPQEAGGQRIPVPAQVPKASALEVS